MYCEAGMSLHVSPSSILASSVIPGTVVSPTNFQLIELSPTTGVILIVDASVVLLNVLSEFGVTICVTIAWISLDVAASFVLAWLRYKSLLVLLAAR